MHACIHKASGFIGGKGPRLLKKLSFCQAMVMLDYVCVQSFMITHKQCFMLIVKYKVICILCSNFLRVVAIGYTILLRSHDNGNVGLHVYAEFHDHTYAVLYAHSKV